MGRQELYEEIIPLESLSPLLAVRKLNDALLAIFIAIFPRCDSDMDEVDSDASFQIFKFYSLGV